MRTKPYQAIALSALALVTLWSSGCATVTSPPPSPKVTIEAETRPPGAEALQQEAASGQLVKFGQLRTVVVSSEEVIGEDGRAREVTEIRPELESELAARDFRMFSSSVGPSTDIAKLSRETKAQLVIDLKARSKFVNSTGKFSKYRAAGEIRAIRGRDGTLLAVARSEKMGPRSQNAERAGELALRTITTNLVSELVAKLFDKQDQLLWAGIVIDQVVSAERAQEILRALEASPVIDYVELLSWDSVAREAVYEVTYSARHDSDLIDVVNRIKGINLRTADYDPGSMSVFQEILRRYHKR